VAIRVIHVLTEIEPFSEYHGGAISRVVANLIQGDADPLVIAPRADDSWGYRPEQVRCVEGFDRYGKMTKFHKNRLPLWIKLPLLLRVLRPALSDLRPDDVVWVHNRAEVAAAISPLVRRHGAKLVLHMHNSHLRLPQQAKAIRDIELDRLVCVSRFIQEEGASAVRPGTELSVLYNGANESLFYPMPKAAAEEEPIILFASRLVPDKGAHILLKAMRILHEKGVRGRAVVVGGSAFGNSKTTRYIQALHRDAPPNVEFHSYCSGAPLAARFREADIFCLPSVFNDPFPLAPLEAMASHLPVVASKTGGIPEAFAHGGAILVEKEDPAQLAEGLERLIVDPILRSRTAADGFAAYKQFFTWDVIRESYQSLLREVRETQPA
jgi:spore coat protein SA